MPDIYWNPLAVNYLIEIILVALIATYFAYHLLFAAGENKRVRETGLLFFTYLACLVALLLQLLSTSLHPDLANSILPWVGPSAAAAMSSFLMFAYQFQRSSTEWRWGGVLLGLLLLALVGMEVFIAVERHVLLQDGIVEFRDSWVDIPFATGFLVALFFFVLRLTRLVARDKRIGLLSGFASATWTLLWPPTVLPRDAAALRAFFYVFSMPFLYGLVLVLRSYGVMDWTAAIILGDWLMLLTFTSFIVAYLNFVPERSSFRTKLIGITLVPIFCILCGVSWLLGSVYADVYEAPHYLSDRTSILFEPALDGSYVARRTGYYFDEDFGARVDDPTAPIALQFPFPFYGTAYDQLFAREAGIVGFESFPLWRDVQYKFGPQPAIFLIAAELQSQAMANAGALVRDDVSGVFVKSTNAQLTLTWNRLVSSFQPDEEYSFQLNLYPTGAIEMVFVDLPEAIRSEIFTTHSAPLMMGIVPGFRDRQVSALRFASALPYQSAPNEGIMESYRIDFLEYLDQIYQPFAYFILASSLFVLILLPQFFKVNLDQPLKQLLAGVQSIMDGKLATSIEVRHRDEIGYLASSFNKMAKAQKDLVQSLEDKVAQRTSEATEYAAKNARLEERSHLSRELHDAVSQTLFSANLIADTLPKLHQGDPRRFSEAVSEIQRLNKDALIEMRNLLLELRPEKLSAFPFGQLLKSIIETVEENFSVKINCIIESDTALPSHVQLAFYRIAQECLTNAAKHAKAKRVEVYFDGMQNQALLSIKDNGGGFDLNDLPPGRMGVHFMRERVEEIGGTLNIETFPGKGTSIEAIWFENEHS